VQNLEDNFEGLCDKKRDDMCIPGILLFMWGVVPSFLFDSLVAASQKNPISALRKWKIHFLLDEMKIGLRGVPQPCVCPIWPHFDKLCQDQRQI
jgi:hypothetical protein